MRERPGWTTQPQRGIGVNIWAPGWYPEHAPTRTWAAGPPFTPGIVVPTFSSTEERKSQIGR